MNYKAMENKLTGKYREVFEKARQKVFDHCEEKGKNIIEYAKENP